MKQVSLSLLILVLSLLLCGQALGQGTEKAVRKLNMPPLVIGNEIYEPHGKMRLGPFRFHPFFSEYFGYDSNILMTESDPIDDYPLISEVGARFDLAHSKQMLLTGYRLRHNEYTQHGGGDNTEHEIELLGDFHLDSFFIKIEDNYANLFEPTVMHWNTKARREENRGKLAFGFDLNKLYLGAAYSMRTYHFQKRGYDRRLEIYFPGIGGTYDRLKNSQSIVSGEIGYKLSPKTRMSIKIDSGSLNYKEDIQNDYSYTSVFLGMNYTLTDKVKSFLYLGSTSQSVDVENNPQTKEFSGFTASGSLAYRLSRKSTLNATLLRELQYNAFVNYMLVTKVEALIRYQWTQKVRLSLRLTFEQSSPSEKTTQTSSSTSTGGGISSRYDLSRSLAAGLDLEFSSKSSSLDEMSYSNTKASVFLTIHF